MVLTLKILAEMAGHPCVKILFVWWRDILPPMSLPLKKNKMHLDAVLYVGKEEHVKNPSTNVFDVT